MNIMTAAVGMEPGYASTGAVGGIPFIVLLLAAGSVLFLGALLALGRTQRVPAATRYSGRRR